jgi:hypothetical protein
MPQITLRPILLVIVLFVVSCGGGGGGGGAKSNPSVSIAGVKSSYWQDEAINISFSVSNMDSATTNYTIAGLEEGYDFTLDSRAGTFRTIPDQYTDAGEYSYTITATDGSGKTASRSFQFRVDAVVIGASQLSLYDEGQNGRRLRVARSRDGLTGIAAASVSLDDAGLIVNNLTCFGETNVSGAVISGSLSCGGLFPAQIDSSGLAVGLTAIGGLDISLNVNEVDFGSITFIGLDGAQLEIWRETDLFSESIQNFDGWPENLELRGRYVPVAIGHQYESLYSFQEAQNGALSFYDAFQGGPSELLIDSNYTISSEASASSTSACIINGDISRLSLDEYALVHGDKGYNWRYESRIISGELSATNCSGLGARAIDKSIDQPLGPFIVETRKFSNSEGDDIRLEFYGSGIDRPFMFTAWQICTEEGIATPFNNAVLQKACD